MGFLGCMSREPRQSPDLAWGGRKLGREQRHPKSSWMSSWWWTAMKRAHRLSDRWVFQSVPLIWIFRRFPSLWIKGLLNDKRIKTETVDNISLLKEMTRRNCLLVPLLNVWVNQDPWENGTTHGFQSFEMMLIFHRLVEEEVGKMQLQLGSTQRSSRKGFSSKLQGPQLSPKPKPSHEGTGRITHTSSVLFSGYCGVSQ